MRAVDKKRVDRVQNYILDNSGVDYILEVYEAPDFVECVCKEGGDTITYRAYDKGSDIKLYER